jgi:hypothetical protein
MPGGAGALRVYEKGPGKLSVTPLQISTTILVSAPILLLSDELLYEQRIALGG